MKRITVRERKLVIIICVLMTVLILSGCGVTSAKSQANATTEIVNITDAGTGSAADAAEPTESSASDFSIPEEISVECTVNTENESLFQHANIILDCDSNSFLELFDYGDKVRVEFNTGEIIETPVFADYDDVLPGEILLRVKPDKDYIGLATNYGSIGYELGFLEDAPSDNQYLFEIIESQFPQTAKITLIEKNAYSTNYFLGNLTESQNREDYPNLNDEDYANFRTVSGGDIAPGVLYRSSSPIDGIIARNTFADAAMKNHGIKTVVNMSDRETSAKAMDGYDQTYYSTCNILFSSLSMAFGTDTFNDGIADCIRFIANNEGPYLVHCAYGKDRTGLMCAILESLCNADVKEIQDDYYKTYEYLFNIGGNHPLSLEQEILIKEIILDNLSYTYSTEVTAENHTELTKAYLRIIGITDEEMELVIRHLTTSSQSSGKANA